jgi:hypothetical protein
MLTENPLRICLEGIARTSLNDSDAECLVSREAVNTLRESYLNHSLQVMNVCPLARQSEETMGQSAATDCSSHFLFRKWRFLGEDTGCVLVRAVEELSLASLYE